MISAVLNLTFYLSINCTWQLAFKPCAKVGLVAIFAGCSTKRAPVDAQRLCQVLAQGRRSQEARHSPAMGSPAAKRIPGAPDRFPIPRAGVLLAAADETLGTYYQSRGSDPDSRSNQPALCAP